MLDPTSLVLVAQSESVAKSGDSTKTALIAALFTRVGIILKDLIFKWAEEYRAVRRAESAIYDRYSKPLTASASSLIVRLNELLFHGPRSDYLKPAGILKGPGSTFRTYKKISTAYRLATLIAWMRACRREFSHVRVAGAEQDRKVLAAINELENALADGSEVERTRIAQLSELWKFRKTEDESDVSELGIIVDNAIWEGIRSAGVEDASEIKESDRKEFCRRLANVISEHLSVGRVPDRDLDETWIRAFRIVSIRETWIYKDWLDAIGDAMLKRIEAEDRKFEVIGYSDFEEVIKGDDGIQKQWFCRVLDVFDDVDFSTDDGFDARRIQIRSIAVAASRLLLALDEIQGSRSIVGERVKTLAQKVINKFAAATLT
jgi:hypothetical protein